MKRASRMLVAAWVLSATAVAASAQSSQEELKAKYEAKIAEDWYTSAGWISDYDAALAKSKETGKPIVAYFSRSYSP